ncbi:MAG TPA: guanylate kinase [Gammaproteobacteria bacterium]|nr:guanylate kinase [Gammaproteobacteria bacterium]
MAGSTRPRGRLVVLAAPSGAGKTTLVRSLLARRPDLEFSVSYTTRPKRKSEIEGRDYFFVDERRFKEMVDRDEFLEHARVFDHWYGTGRRHVEELLDSGRDVLLEIDWQGARQVRARAPDALTVFILPPNAEALETRLRTRGTDSPEVVERRLRDALGDMSHWQEFDYVVVNDDLERAADELAEIVAGRGARHRTDDPATKAAVGRILGGAPRP